VIRSQSTERIKSRLTAANTLNGLRFQVQRYSGLGRVAACIPKVQVWASLPTFACSQRRPPHLTRNNDKY
jgi:hypothetical protein